MLPNFKLTNYLNLTKQPHILDKYPNISIEVYPYTESIYANIKNKDDFIKFENSIPTYTKALFEEILGQKDFYDEILLAVYMNFDENRKAIISKLHQKLMDVIVQVMEKCKTGNFRHYFYSGDEIICDIPHKQQLHTISLLPNDNINQELINFKSELGHIRKQYYSPTIDILKLTAEQFQLYLKHLPNENKWVKIILERDEFFASVLDGVDNIQDSILRLQLKHTSINAQSSINDLKSYLARKRAYPNKIQTINAKIQQINSFIVEYTINGTLRYKNKKIKNTLTLIESELHGDYIKFLNLLKLKYKEVLADDIMKKNTLYIDCVSSSTTTRKEDDITKILSAFDTETGIFIDDDEIMFQNDDLQYDDEFNLNYNDIYSLTTLDIDEDTARECLEEIFKSTTLEPLILQNLDDIIFHDDIETCIKELLDSRGHIYQQLARQITSKHSIVNQQHQMIPTDIWYYSFKQFKLNECDPSIYHNIYVCTASCIAFLQNLKKEHTQYMKMTESLKPLFKKYKSAIYYTWANDEYKAELNHLNNLIKCIEKWRNAPFNLDSIQDLENKKEFLKQALGVDVITRETEESIEQYQKLDSEYRIDTKIAQILQSKVMDENIKVWLEEIQKKITKNNEQKLSIIQQYPRIINLKSSYNSFKMAHYKYTIECNKLELLNTDDDMEINPDTICEEIDISSELTKLQERSDKLYRSVNQYDIINYEKAIAKIPKAVEYYQTLEHFEEMLKQNNIINEFQYAFMNFTPSVLSLMCNRHV